MQNWSTFADGDWCLVSSGDITWLQTQDSNNRLFVPSCYHTLVQECQKVFDIGIQGVFLVGTPGVGKSCFLDYALHCFLCEGKAVLYLVGPRNKAYFFRPDGGIEKHPLGTVLDDTDGLVDKFDIVLYDPHEHASRTDDVHISVFQSKNFVVALPPDGESCMKLRKDTRASATLHMGTLSLAEAKEMRSSCYPKIPLGAVSTRYKVFGGIARHLFKPLLPNNVDGVTRDVLERQQDALNDITQNPLRIDGGQVSSESSYLWSLYHLQPVVTAGGGMDPYHYTIEPCCESVRTRIRDRLMEKDVSELWNVYANTRKNHTTLRGIRFEAYAHKKILTQGLHGLAVSLTPNGLGRKTLEVNIPASLPTITLAKNDLEEPFQSAVNQARNMCATGGYLVPRLSNFPVADSVYVSLEGAVVFQMKASPTNNKPLLDDKIFSIQCAVGESTTTVVLVVPDNVTMLQMLPTGPTPRLEQYRFILNESSR